MNNRSLASILIQMGERDKLRLFDKETNKEYRLMGFMCTHNTVENRYIIDLSISEVKHDGSK